MKIAAFALALLSAPKFSVLGQSAGESALANLWNLNADAEMVKDTNDNGVLTVSFSHGGGGTP